MDFMKKMAFSEMEKAMVASNLVGEKLYGIIVFTRDSFSRYYTLEERSYLVDNMTSMHFQPGAASGAIVGDCLDEAEALKASNLISAKREASRKSCFYWTTLVIGTELNEDGFIKPESVLTSKIDGKWEDYEC